METSSPVKSFASELILWFVATAVSMGVPVGAVYGWSHVVEGHPASKTALLLSVAAALTATWGCWSALVWSRNRLMRGAMEIATMIPGVALACIAGFGFYVGKGSITFWLTLLGGGLGTVAAGFMLARRMASISTMDSGFRHLVGIGLFPLLSTLGSGLVAYLWFSFISDPLQTDWRSLLSYATFAVTAMSLVFITTVVPAASSLICRRLVGSRT